MLHLFNRPSIDTEDHGCPVDGVVEADLAVEELDTHLKSGLLLADRVRRQLLLTPAEARELVRSRELGRWPRLATCLHSAR